MFGKRLWVVSELYHPETTSTGYILTRLAEGLTEYFSVNVICSQPTYSARGIKAPRREVHNGVNILRCWGSTLDKDILLFRLVNLITITMSLFWHALVHLRQEDHVLVVTNPPSLPFAVALACKLRKTRCSLIVHDVYPDLAIAAGKLKKGALLARVLDALNIKLYQSMTHIFVLGRDMYSKVSSKIGPCYTERVVIATNWADLDLVTPLPRNENPLLEELGLKNKFVLQYAGNIGYPNDIKSIVEAAVLLRFQQDIHFLFIGSGARKLEIESAIVRNKLSNITTLKPLPRSSQSVFLNACDVGLIALVNGMKGVSVPSRTYNILASGKPIIAVTEQGSELAMLIEEEEVGWVVSPGDPQRLVEVILVAKSQPVLLAQMGNRARRVAETKYSFERTLNIFQATLLGANGTI